MSYLNNVILLNIVALVSSQVHIKAVTGLLIVEDDLVAFCVGLRRLVF